MKNFKQKGFTIGRLNESSHLSFGGGFCVAMIVVGALVVAFSALGESNAIRLTTSYTFWTGWNVMWGIGAMLGRRRHYTIIRFDEGKTQ